MTRPGDQPKVSELDATQQRIWDVIEERIEAFPTDGIAADGQRNVHVKWQQRGYVDGLRSARLAAINALPQPQATTVGVTDDMVDAALNASWGEDGRPIWSFINDEHPHALMTTALKAALIDIPGAEKGEAWQLVPVKPTEKMAEAGTHARWAKPLRDPDNSREIWASMLNAAPPRPGNYVFDKPYVT